MPRIRRQKTFDAIFHIMCRSIKEVDLFKDDQDKAAYLGFVKKYQKIYEFKVYGYCLMDNHGHLLIDANGSDISKVMHGINFSYAQYFNHRHKRHGHLFQDRFKSKMVEHERYLFALSAYIHNNPIDIQEYRKCPEKHPFSSLSVYLGLSHDPSEILDEGFILSLFGEDPKRARENYLRLVYKCSDRIFKDDIEFEEEGTEYRSYKKLFVRDISPEEVVDFVVSKVDVSRTSLRTKNCRNVNEAKALLVLLMRSICDFKCSTICKALGNITQGSVSRFSVIGMELIEREETYREIVEQFIERYAS